MKDLTAEQVRELFDYDEENGWLIRKKDEYGRAVNRPCGHKPTHSSGYGYGKVRIGGKDYLAHRIIWLWYYGTWPEGDIDHINRNKIDNRIDNLRVVSKSENGHNQNIHRTNTSGYPGVSWHKASKKYQARIMGDNKRINLGFFNAAEEAYRAYQLAKIKYHPNSPIAQQYRKELGLD